MSVSPLHPITNFQSYISGEVTIDPSAAIATGVVLKADPNSQIIISAGVCIGMGVILHAYGGTLEVEAGANLGAGVLVVGQGKIGANACIGSATTIVNCSIEPGQVVAPGSLIGDTSRRIAEPPATTNTIPVPPTATVTTAVSWVAAVQTESVPNPPIPESLTNPGNQQVYGKSSLNRLLSTLLPHRQALNQPIQEGSSPEDST